MRYYEFIPEGDVVSLFGPTPKFKLHHTSDEGDGYIMKSYSGKPFNIKLKGDGRAELLDTISISEYHILSNSNDAEEIVINYTPEITIAGDSNFERSISSLLGFRVMFAETMMQDDGTAVLLPVGSEGTTSISVPNDEAKQIKAVTKNYMALNQIDNPSEAVLLAAVKASRLALTLIPNPTEEMSIIAAKQSMHSLYNIKNQTPAVIQAALTAPDASEAGLKNINKPEHRAWFARKLN